MLTSIIKLPTVSICAGADNTVGNELGKRKLNNIAKDLHTSLGKQKPAHSWGGGEGIKVSNNLRERNKVFLFPPSCMQMNSAVMAREQISVSKKASCLAVTHIM